MQEGCERTSETSNGTQMKLEPGQLLLHNTLEKKINRSHYYDHGTNLYQAWFSND